MMDKKYLIEHLTKLTKVICGKENVDTVFAQRLKSGRFEFGYEKEGKEFKNIVTKQVAIILSLDVNRYLEYKQTKKKKDVPHKRKRKVSM